WDPRNPAPPVTTQVVIDGRCYRAIEPSGAPAMGCNFWLRVPAHEPDVGAAAGRVEVLDDAESAPPVDRDVAERAGREEGAGAVGPGPREPSLDQGPPQSAPLEHRVDRDRVELPQRLGGGARIDPVPERVVAPSSIVGELLDPRLAPGVFPPPVLL